VGNHCGSFMLWLWLWLWRGVRRNEPRCLLVVAATGVRRVDEAADAQPDVACGVVFGDVPGVGRDRASWTSFVTTRVLRPGRRQGPGADQVVPCLCRSARGRRRSGLRLHRVWRARCTVRSGPALSVSEAICTKRQKSYALGPNLLPGDPS
jgi:hypothetical protein